MKVPRALGRILPRCGHRPSGRRTRSGCRARLLAYRVTGLVALTPLLLSSLVPAAAAAPEAADSGGSTGGSGSASGADSAGQSVGQSDGPTPVQILDLTTSSGQATEIAQSGLDDAQTSPSSGGGDDSPAGTETSTPSTDGASSTSGDAGTSVLLKPVTGAGGTVRQAVARAAGATGGRTPSILPAATDPQADATLLTDPLEVDHFLVAGFTWTGSADLPEGVRIYLRVRENGTWSPWYLNEAADAGRDDRTTSGTGEFVTGGADAIQASVVGGSLPAGLKLALVPSQPQGEEVLDAADLKTTEAAPTPVIEDADAASPLQPGQSGVPGGSVEPAHSATATATSSLIRPADLQATVLPAATTANGLPVPVTTRGEWGANPSYMSWDPDYASAGHVVVHHTAGTNSYSAGQSASIVRGIYYYHAVTLDWGDIGYNFLIDKYGTVFEGRSGSTTAPAGRMSVGAHARGVNTGTMGLSMMGDYSSVSPSDTQLSSVGKMAGWFLKRAGVTDANGWAGLHVWTTERYQAGSTISMPRILGHRDVGYTTCPGNVGYSKLGTIRTIAQQQINGASAWKSESGSWYYLGAGGAKVAGWVSDGGGWYYLDASKGGAMATGWLRDAGGWYYLDGSKGGAMATGWVSDGGNWYYLTSDGAMVTGWLFDSNHWYYLGADGAMATGWVADGGSWYYLDASKGGAMATGWVSDSGSWYYLTSDGAMATGWVADGGSWYYLDASKGGAMATGWVSDSGSWYYLTSDGAMATGWVADGGSWYYLDASKGGAMVTGRVKIEGRWSTFAAGGAWQGYEGLHPVLASPTASRQQVIDTMVSTYNSSGHAYPSGTLSQGGAATAQSFFTTLYDEAVAEGVSPELLFAQVMKETAWLQSGGDVSAQQFNFGGLGATGGGAAGASFPSVQIGLRAQVQHLRAYADASATPQKLSRSLVDPRFTYVRKGSAVYVEHLGIQENPQRTGWATARNYGNDLAAMIDRYFG
ncbi:N-acetylmuramoyl-L-alanine amidase [Actinomyces viscosus]|uniref:Endo-beta-N-acetylglucosaminidase n=1 Tax=Actinomyces viscosus TaxID=1656 RepID=A0A448PL37_ACTVI|nr:N-acetylmuramoyl-L-alanine amidase [Actinomyces viscosus]VEI16134.1 Putative endo-beta-N-acetylglucosaminidase precursor [Actinomyces viscosus]